jgi:type IV secretory pathway VirB2 component (pilin)
MTRLKPIPLLAATLAGSPRLLYAQGSPFLTGVTSLQENILEWLTPVAIILVMVLGGMAMANRISWGWCIGAIFGIAIAFGAPQIIVENCGNTLILRCSGSDRGGTANFASRLIGQREVLRTNRSHSRRPTEFLSSTTLSEHIGIEPAVLDSQIEQLPDLSGYLKFASVPNWQRVSLAVPEDFGRTRASAEAVNFWRQWRARVTTAHAQKRASHGLSSESSQVTPRASREGAEYE